MHRLALLTSRCSAPLVWVALAALVCCATVTTASAQPEETPVSIALRPAPGVPAEGLRGTARAIWYGSGEREDRTFKLSSEQPTMLSLPPGRWLVKTTMEEHWVADLQVEVAARPLQKVVMAWPVGTLSGGIREVPRGEDTPKAFWALFSSTSKPDGSQPDLSGKVVCPVSETLSWECRVPAGLFDFRFQADGFVPRYQWGVTVSAGRTRKLGKLDLRRGTSVLGWVRTIEDAPASGARLTLSPYEAAPVRDRSRLQALTFRTEVNARGFFQVDGVPPGAYVLEAAHASFAPASTTVRVVEGQATEVSNPPLILDYPKTLHVYVDPPVDPWDKPWTLQVQHLSRSGMQILDGRSAQVSLDGSLDLKGLNPASYLISLLTSRGDSWWTELREVEDDETLPISLDIVQVEGSIFLADEPLAASLTFGGANAATHATVEADDEGRFAIVLPHAGAWPVRVVSDAKKINRELPRVEVRPRNGTDVASVLINLPDTRLFGTVVDENEKPVVKALVTVGSRGEQREQHVQQITDNNGQFDIVGLAEGPALLRAEVSADFFSDTLWLDIRETGAAAPRTIRLRRQKRLQGTILSQAGGVPGALVKIAPADVPYIAVPGRRTDAQGSFEAVVPRTARELFITVSPPGFALRMMKISVPEDGQLVIPVEAQGGTLVIDGSGDIDFSDPMGDNVVLFHAGSREGILYLRNWARQLGVDMRDMARHTLPRLEPGSYTACRVRSIELPGEDRRTKPTGGCVSGELLSNGELVLDLSEHAENR